MKLLIYILLVQSSFASILPKNNLIIPVNQKDLHISEEEFNYLIDKVVLPYKGMMGHYGASDFIVNRYWENGKVNASAGKKKDVFLLNIYGGLARYKSLTKDAFTMILCHEIGHLIGGAPTWKPFNQASSEGQADYFATLKCFRRVHEKEKLKITNDLVPKYALNKCLSAFENELDFNLCKRSALAQLSLITVMSELAGLKSIPQFETPDPYQRTVILFNGYPNAQCRLDTLFAGALCDNDIYELLDMNLYNKGVCSLINGDMVGMRPRCWYIGREDN